jgi:hypothetical protein
VSAVDSASVRFGTVAADDDAVKAELASSADHYGQPRIERRTRMQKFRLALAAIMVALAAVSAVDSASAFEQIVVEWRDQKDDGTSGGP